MKIRIKGNSLRYRLTRTDVSRFEKDGYLEERVQFAGSVLIYCLKKTDRSELSAVYEDHTITLYMPVMMLAEWISSDIVGFQNNSGDLHLLVEKDFTCLDTVDEDQRDHYPNPLALKYHE
jgi:hypothetical protein